METTSNGFRIIRIGSGYDLAIVVTPGDARPETNGAKFYRINNWDIPGYPTNELHEVTERCAMSYFSGIADGIGYIRPRGKIFSTLDECRKYIVKRRERLERFSYRSTLRYLISSGEPRDEEVMAEAAERGIDLSTL